MDLLTKINLLTKTNFLKFNTYIMAIKKKGIGKTMEVGGNRFTRQTCSKSKTAAQKEAAKIRRDKNRLARVVKDTESGNYCVFQGRKRKK